LFTGEDGIPLVQVPACGMHAPAPVVACLVGNAVYALPRIDGSAVCVAGEGAGHAWCPPAGKAVMPVLVYRLPCTVARRDTCRSPSKISNALSGRRRNTPGGSRMRGVQAKCGVVAPRPESRRGRRMRRAPATRHSAVLMKTMPYRHGKRTKEVLFYVRTERACVNRRPRRHAMRYLLFGRQSMSAMMSGAMSEVGRIECHKK